VREFRDSSRNAESRQHALTRVRDAHATSPWTRRGVGRGRYRTLAFGEGGAFKQDASASVKVGGESPATAKGAFPRVGAWMIGYRETLRIPSAMSAWRMQGQPFQ
jgi:hypothetical protein